MVGAYENGAKYIIVFDSNANFTQNVLQQGQLDAMKQFWHYVQANPRQLLQLATEQPMSFLRITLTVFADQMIRSGGYGTQIHLPLTSA